LPGRYKKCKTSFPICHGLQAVDGSLNAALAKITEKKFKQALIIHFSTQHSNKKSLSEIPERDLCGDTVFIDLKPICCKYWN